MWAYQALVLTYGMTISRTSSGSPQLTEDVVRLGHQSMFRFDAEEHGEVNANAEAHQSLQRLKVLPSEPMVPCPHERKVLARGQTSAMADWTTLDLDSFWAPFTSRCGLHKAVGVPGITEHGGHNVGQGLDELRCHWDCERRSNSPPSREASPEACLPAIESGAGWSWVMFTLD